MSYGFATISIHLLFPHNCSPLCSRVFLVVYWSLTSVSIDLLAFISDSYILIWPYRVFQAATLFAVDASCSTSASVFPYRVL